MKQTIIIMSFLLLACTAKEPTVGERAAEIYNEYTKKMNAAESIEDMAQIENESDFAERLQSLQPEWDALVVDGDSSAYYAEREKMRKSRETYHNIKKKRMNTLYKDKIN